MAGRDNSPEDNSAFDNQFENDFSDPEEIEADDPVVPSNKMSILERKSVPSHGDENPVLEANYHLVDKNETEVQRNADKKPDQEGGSNSSVTAKEDQGNRSDVSQENQTRHGYCPTTEERPSFHQEEPQIPTECSMQEEVGGKAISIKSNSDVCQAQSHISDKESAQDNRTSQTPKDKKKVSSRKMGHKNRVTGDTRREPVWKLNDEDLLCLPLVTKGAEGTGSNAIKQGKRNPNMTTKGRRLRLFNKKTNGSSRNKYTSVLGMIKSIAKTSGIDLVTLLLSSERVFGYNVRLPCMQCLEAPGQDIDSVLESVKADFGTGRGANDRCPKCGGQVLTLAKVGKLISQMRVVLQEKGLVVHDVYTEGNCLFSAVVDQLRIRGDFSFTVNSLRQAAVQYLRENPVTEDGQTPLAMFLTNNESWETYLNKMAQDGEWGDHIVLGAISNVTGMAITIYGGMSGLQETIIKPKNLPVSTQKSESATIFLGHMMESHYISLRPMHWKNILFGGIEAHAQMLNYSTRVPCPIKHIDLIIRQACRMDYIKSFQQELVEKVWPAMLSDKHKDTDLELEAVGSMMCRMCPSKFADESNFEDFSVFFSSVNDDSTGSEDATVVFLQVPNDTVIVNSLSEAKRVDLVGETDVASSTTVHLIPKVPTLWPGQTVKVADDKIFVKHFDLKTDAMKSLLSVLNSNASGVKMKYTFAFKCKWPEVAAEWSVRRRPANFPNSSTLQTVVETGCHAIRCTSDQSLQAIIDKPISDKDTVDDYSWYYTFAAAEKEISRFLTQAQRQIFLLLKLMVDKSSDEHKIPNYILKSTFFYACENIEQHVWKSKPGECLMILLKNLRMFIASEYVPHYFIADKNLLSGTPRTEITTWSSKLGAAQAQPFVTLFFVLDKLNVLSSELGSFVEEIIQEMINFESGGFQDNSFNGQQDALMTARSTLLLNFIFEEDYQNALYMLQDMADEGEPNKAGTATKIPEGRYFEVLKYSCWGIYIGFKWLFALFVDINLKTNLTSNLSDYGAVHITDVFGPECLEELPDTLVPETFKIENGDLFFAYKAQSVFSQCVSRKCFIKAFKFYLKRYAELAGDALMIPTRVEHVLYAFGTVSEGARGQKQLMQECLTASSQIIYLHDVYVDLFNMCFYGHQTEEFREMMPVMTKIAESMGTPFARRNLKTMWISLGEMGKAAHVTF